MPYIQPTNLKSALQLLVESGGKIVAGGTDVFPSAKQGHIPRNILDITAIKGMSDIVIEDGWIRIGAAVTWNEIVKADLPNAFNALKQAALEVGSIQIQNAGTIGGNLCNASPAADGVPPLLILDAVVEIASIARGIRTLKISDFILHVRKTALADDEIVTAVLIPAPSAKETSAFEKLGSRRYLVISITMTAALIELDEQGKITKARVAVGCCSPVAVRLEKLEKQIVGLRVDEVRILPEHLSALSPIDDIRGTQGYRLDVVAEQCARAIKNAAKQ